MTDSTGGKAPCALMAVFERTKTRVATRSLPKRLRAVHPRGPRWFRVVPIGASAVLLSCAMLTSVSLGAGASAAGAATKTLAAPSALSVRHVLLRTHSDRITGTATIRNIGPVTVRPTTGLIGIRGVSSGRGIGLSTFALGSLRPGSSTTVRLRTPALDGVRSAPGTYRTMLCVDVYSQLRRFAQSSNCTDDGHFVLSTSASIGKSGPPPSTTLVSRHTTSSTPSTTELRFGSTTRRSTFQCSLDGGPWLTCSSPRSYRALVDGAHSVAIRAISPTGRADSTPAGTSWVVLPISRPKTKKSTTDGSSVSGRRQRHGDRLRCADERHKCGDHADFFRKHDGHHDLIRRHHDDTNPARRHHHHPTQRQQWRYGPARAAGEDGFNRSDSGGLGAGWAAMNDGGLTISGDAAVEHLERVLG